MQEDFLFYAAALALISLAFWFWNNLSDEIQQEQYRYKLFQASLIEVNGSDELQNYLDYLSVDERLKFKRDYIKRVDLSPFADYYETQRADRFQEKEFQEFMNSKGFKFNNVTLSSNYCSSRSYKPLDDYNEILKSIDEQEELYPDDSLNKLSSGFRFGY